MGNQNNVLFGPNGGTPMVADGAFFENIVTSANFQVKEGSGVFQSLGVNTGGTTSTATAYDGSSDTVTITIAAPGVFTWTDHGLVAGSAVKFTTTGALPTGLTANTTYYVADDTNLTEDTFAVSDTKAHALAGTNKVTTTGSQSGVQTGWNVSTPIGKYATTAQSNVRVGAAFSDGLIVLTADGGGAADLTVLYN